MKTSIVYFLILKLFFHSIVLANQAEFEELKTLTCLEVSSLYGEETDFIIEIFGMEVIVTYDIPLELVQEKKLI